MKVAVTVEVPELIYQIYTLAAKELQGYTVEQVMSSALHAYALRLYEEMREEGELDF